MHNCLHASVRANCYVYGCISKAPTVRLISPFSVYPEPEVPEVKRLKLSYECGVTDPLLKLGASEGRDSFEALPDNFPTSLKIKTQQGAILKPDLRNLPQNKCQLFEYLCALKRGLSVQARILDSPGPRHRPCSRFNSWVILRRTERQVLSSYFCSTTHLLQLLGLWH